MVTPLMKARADTVGIFCMAQVTHNPAVSSDVPGLTDRMLALEKNRFNANIAACSDVTGLVLSNTTEFIRAYSQDTLKLACALECGDVPLELCGAAADVMAPSAAGAATEQAKARLYAKVETADSQFVVCYRCKSKKVTDEPIQTGAVDEAMSYLYSCTECGASWRR